MKYSKNNDNNLMYNSYLYNLNKNLLSEQERAEVEHQRFLVEQQQQLANKIVSSPEAIKAMEDAAKKLFDKLMREDPDAFKAAMGKGPKAVDAYIAKKQEEFQKAAQGAIKESLELQEGFFSRTASLAGAALDKGKELMSGKNTNVGFRQMAILKHFEKLKNNLGAHLRELQRDMKTTSGVDTKVKDSVDRTIQSISNKFGLSLQASGWEKARHTIGRFGGLALGAAGFAALFGPAAAAFTGALGLKGVATAAVSKAVTAGAFSLVKDLAKGQKPNYKQMAIAAVTTGIGAGLTQGVTDHFSGQAEISGDVGTSTNISGTDTSGDSAYLDPDTETGPETPSQWEEPHTDNVSKNIETFKQDTKTDFNPTSTADNAAVDIKSSFDTSGLTKMGTTPGSKQLFRNFADSLGNDLHDDKYRNIISQAVGKTIDKLSPEDLEEIARGKLRGKEVADGALRTGEALMKFIDRLKTLNPGVANDPILSNKLQQIAQKTIQIANRR